MRDGGLGGGALTPGPRPHALHAPRFPAQLTGWLHPQPWLPLGSRRSEQRRALVSCVFTATVLQDVQPGPPPPTPPCSS